MIKNKKTLVLGASTKPARYAFMAIEKLVEKNLDVPVHIANPFVNMALSSRIKPQILSNDAPAMMIACGLALRSFD